MPQPIQGITQRCVAEIECLATGHDHQVQAVQGLAAMAEAFAYQPLETIAVDSVACLLAGDSQTEPRRLAIVGPGKNGEVSVLGTLRPLEDPSEFVGLQQAGGAWKIPARDQQLGLLGSQAGAALGAACLDDLAAIGGGHAGTETVGAGALQAAGLKCAFHDAVPISECVETSRRTRIAGPAKKAGKNTKTNRQCQ